MVKGQIIFWTIPDSKVHGANMGPTWVLSAPDGPHFGPMNLAIRDSGQQYEQDVNSLTFLLIYKNFQYISVASIQFTT